jgi:SAM-dependent methyltransferase
MLPCVLGAAARSGWHRARRWLRRGLSRVLRLPYVPDAYIAGRAPTLNGHGFMELELNAISRRMVDSCPRLDGPVLDIGCAYGVATVAALRRGAAVVACDMDERHLRVLRHRTPRRHRGQLRTVAGVLPNVDFPPGSFAAIHCSRCLHFLLPDELRAALGKMRGWLRSGGRAYFVTTTCYAKPWDVQLPEYERRKAAGEPWPGLIEDVLTCLPLQNLEDGMPRHINTLEPDVLRRECELAGFRVLECGFLDVPQFSSEARDHAWVIAESARAPGAE